MLQDSLPAIPNRDRPDIELASEALALTLLAGYNDVAIPGRVSTAFYRSYGYSGFTFFPFVPGARPGFVMAVVNTPDANRCTIALEGMRTFEQLRSFWGTIGATQMQTPAPFNTDRPGRLYEPARAFAMSIWATLITDPTFIAARAVPGMQFVFTGHSLGAMVAEILGEIAEWPMRGHPIKVVKFGCPRIGTRAWINGLATRVRRESYYVGRDPVDVIPYLTFSNVGTDFIPLSGGPGCWFQHDADACRVTTHGQFLDSFHVGGMVQAAAFLRAFQQPRDAVNPWSDHAINFYRFIFTHLCGYRGGLARWRFRYIEMPDDNAFGVNFGFGVGFSDALFALQDPPPANVVVEPADLPSPGDAAAFGEGRMAFLRDRQAPTFDAAMEDTSTWPEPVQPEVARAPAIIAAPPLQMMRVTPNARGRGRWSAAQSH